jgi:putative N-acetylmannosamine-6-phosphate epimerase
VVAEGRIGAPAQARAALAAGAWCVVVGAAITRPQWITAQFVAGMTCVAETPPDAR